MDTTTDTDLNVLVVEDEPGWQAVYADILVEAGYTCHYASSYGEARGLIQRLSFALAIVDLHLASSASRGDNRDGFWLLNAAQQRGVPAIVVSALGEPGEIDRAYDEFRVFAFIEKEVFDRRAFAHIVAEALHEGAPVPSTAEPQVAPGLNELTDREHDVLALLARGDTNRQIAEALHITSNTVKKHVDHILQKFGASSRAGAVAAALRAGLVSEGPK